MEKQYFLPVGLQRSSLHGYQPALTENLDMLDKAKILVLHGLGESGDTIKAKTRFLDELLQTTSPPFPNPKFHTSYPGGFELIYTTAPNPLRPSTRTSSQTEITEREADFSNAWTWGSGNFEQDVVPEYKSSVHHVLGLMKREGPFVGVLGFSVGACMAATVVSLAERAPSREFMDYLGITVEDLPPPLLFGIICSGFMMGNPLYKPLYEPQLQTPVLHTIGEYDTIIRKEDSLKLVERCANSKTVHFVGGHFIPRDRVSREAMLDLIMVNTRLPVVVMDSGYVSEADIELDDDRIYC